jgi:hypothetical protein
MMSFSLLCLAACASAPSQAPVAASPAPRVVVATSPQASATAASQTPDAGGASDSNAKQHAEVVKRALKSGYQVSKLPDGSKHYCVETTSVGTHFTQKSCYTADQLVEVFARQDLQQDQMHQMGLCGGSACAGSK